MVYRQTWKQLWAALVILIGVLWTAADWVGTLSGVYDVWENKGDIAAMILAYSSWFGPLVVLVGVAAYGWMYLSLRREGREDAERLRVQFNHDWKELAQERETLRNTADRAFILWKRNGTAFSSLSDLVRAVDIPMDLLSFRGNLNEYAAKAFSQWVAEWKELLDFCGELYPLQEPSPLLTGREWQDFHEARKLLSKFWDEWGERIFGSGVIDLKDIPSNLGRSEAPQLVFLSYVEIALARRTQQMGSGKQGLFKMGKAFEAH